MTYKTCDYCHQTKGRDEFSKIRSACICNGCKVSYTESKQHDYNVNYYKNNKEKSDTYTKTYRDQHKEYLNKLARDKYNSDLEVNRAKQLKYRNKNKDKINAKKREFWDKNASKINANRRSKYIINKNKILIQVSKRRERNKNIINTKKKEMYYKNRKAILTRQKFLRDNENDESKVKRIQTRKKYYENNKPNILDRSRKNYNMNKDKIRKCNSLYKKTPRGKEVVGRSGDKRKRGLGRKPINTWFTGSVCHHLHYNREGKPDNAISMYIPKQLHSSIWHHPAKNIGIKEINKLAWKWYDETYK